MPIARFLEDRISVSPLRRENVALDIPPSPGLPIARSARSLARRTTPLNSSLAKLDLPNCASNCNNYFDHIVFWNNKCKDSDCPCSAKNPSSTNSTAGLEAKACLSRECYSLSSSKNNQNYNSICKQINNGDTVFGNPLSKGAIAGAVIGSVIGALLLGALAFFIWRRYRKNGAAAAPNGTSSETKISPNAAAGSNASNLDESQLYSTNTSEMLGAYPQSAEGHIFPSTTTTITANSLGRNQRGMESSLLARRRGSSVAEHMSLPSPSLDRFPMPPPVPGQFQPHQPSATNPFASSQTGQPGFDAFPFVYQNGVQPSAPPEMQNGTSPTPPPYQDMNMFPGPQQQQQQQQAESHSPHPSPPQQHHQPESQYHSEE